MWETYGRSNPNTRLSLSRALKSVKHLRASDAPETAFGSSLGIGSKTRTVAPQKRHHLSGSVSDPAPQNASVDSTLGREQSARLLRSGPLGFPSPIPIRSDIAPCSTKSLIPRRARKYLTSKENILQPSSTCLSLYSTLLQFCSGPVSFSVLQSCRGNVEQMVAALREDTFVHVTASKLFEIVKDDRSDLMLLSEYATLCHKICLALTGIVVLNKEEQVSGSTTDTSPPETCHFKRFKEALILIILFCSPSSLDKTADAVAWLKTLRELLIDESNEAFPTLCCDDAISYAFASTHLEVASYCSDYDLVDGCEYDVADGCSEASSGQVIPEADFGAVEHPQLNHRAKLTYRIRAMHAYNKYPYKTDNHPKAQWQPMRTWQLRELSLQENSTTSKNDNSAIMLSQELSSTSSLHEDISVIGTEKLRVNWKNQVASAIEQVVRANPEQAMVYDMIPQPTKSLQRPSRLLAAHERVLGDGTKVASRHNDISFERDLFHQRLGKNDYKYEEKLKPLPNGHEIIEAFSTMVKDVERSNDPIKRGKEYRPYKVSQLQHLSSLLTHKPKRKPALPYKVRKRSSVITQPRILHSCNSSTPFTPTSLYVESGVGGLTSTKLRQSYVADPFNFSRSENSCSELNAPSAFLDELSNQEESAKDVNRQKEELYIARALECHERAAKRKKEILEMERTSRY